MQIGSSGSDVSALQVALQKDGESVNSTGAFDEQTASAVTGFQEKYASSILTPNNLKYGTGFVGGATRSQLNALYGCGDHATPSPLPVATSSNYGTACPAWGCGGQSTSSITVPVQTPPTNTTGTNYPPVSVQIQYLMQQLSVLQSQPSTPENQTKINAILEKIRILQGQSSGVTSTATTAYPNTYTTTTVPYSSSQGSAGNGTPFSFYGHTWMPIRVSYDSFSSFGNWFVDPSTKLLHESEVTSLHYKLITTSLPPSADVEVQAIVAMDQGTEMGVCARMSSIGNGYCFATSWGGGNYPQIAKFSNGEQNPAGIASAHEPYPIAHNVDYIVKLRVQGSLISGKIYQAGTPEPTMWMAQANDNSFTNGTIGFYAYGSRPLIKSVMVMTPANIAPTATTTPATGVMTTSTTITTPTTGVTTTSVSTTNFATSTYPATYMTTTTQSSVTTTPSSGTTTITPSSGTTTTVPSTNSSTSQAAYILGIVKSLLNSLQLGL